MSYPDEYEARFEAMYADLAEADALPPSIVMLEEDARRRLPELMSKSFLLDRILAAPLSDNAGAQIYEAGS